MWSRLEAVCSHFGQRYGYRKVSPVSGYDVTLHYLSVLLLRVISMRITTVWRWKTVIYTNGSNTDSSSRMLQTRRAVTFLLDSIIFVAHRCRYINDQSADRFNKPHRGSKKVSCQVSATSNFTRHEQFSKFCFTKKMQRSRARISPHLQCVAKMPCHRDQSKNNFLQLYTVA